MSWPAEEDAPAVEPERFRPPGEAFAGQHINSCEGCDWYVDEMRTTVATVGKITEEEIPSETRDKLLTAFREWKARR